jgi:hypothetical protein
MTGTYDSNSGRSAALRRWAFEDDPAAATAPARNGFRARFERLVDPDGTLPPDERERRADRLLRAHMIDLAARKRAKRAAAALARRPQ